jgi:hypothetical protein
MGYAGITSDYDVQASSWLFCLCQYFTNSNKLT